uniref:Titin n=1 Tax=Hucho hucho TaxID=62062 RepID=A0A4W5MR57_9TELE
MTDLTTTLINKDSLRRDGGEFVLTATNVGGFAKHIFNVKVLDRPGPPGGPLVVSDITSDNCILEWAPPADDGGAEIDHYVIEKRESSRLAWTNSASGLTDTQFKVNKLLKGNEYIFRVMAVNKYGVGEPLESVPTIANNPWVPADPPKDPEVTIITKDSMILMWKAPEYDGGTPITNYNIERKDKIGLRWVKCNKKKVKDLQFKVTGLLVTHEYEFRILAENAAGLSLPSNSSPFYKATDTLYEPGPPGNPRVVDTTKSSITIAWNKPNYDGGSEITGYIVETCVPGEEEWTIVTPPGGLMGTSFTLMNLEEDKECMIQVSAVNSEGIGEEATIPGTPRAQDRLLPPEFDLDAELKKVVNIRACNTLRLFVPIRGRPSPEAKWTKEDGEPISRATIESTTSYTSLVVENVNRFDSGKYVLTIENSYGSNTATPEYDGGAKVTGYIVEKKELPEGRWNKTNFTNIIETEYVATSLVENQQYEFRVIARNAAGVFSLPSYSTGPITAKDEIDPPRISIDPQFTQTVYVNAGDGFKIDADVHGSPIPEILWMKSGHEAPLANTITRDIKNTDSTTLLTVKEAKLEDGGKYTLLLKNPGDLDIDPDLRKVVNIKAGCSLRLFIPIRGRPQPEVKWGKDEGPIKENAQVEVTSSYTSLVIDNVNRFDSGKYTVSAENASGEKSALISVRVLDTPSAPVNLKVKDITGESVTLTWDAPVLDGGAKIRNYIVEKRESTRKAYAAVVTNCHKLSYKVENLQEGCNYYFRVLAENEHGVGLPTATVDPIKASEVPQIPRKLSVVDQTKTSISLAWEKPEHDGGSRIIHYLLEIQPKGSEKWSGVATVRAMESVVNNLNPGEEYIFRVFAINDKGKSDPRELALPVTAKDLVIEPDVRPAFSNYSVRVGKDFKVEIPIAGRPKPAVKWTKDGSILLHTSRVKIANTPDSTTLSITEATGEDGGMYGINVTNVVGEKNATIEIIALDKPGPPSGPVKFDEVTINTATISWGPPKHSGGCQISNYIVQKRDTTTTTWENVAASVARTTLKVQRLKTGAEYQFRIIAQNRYGKSYGLDSHPLTIKYPYKEPGPPGTPFIASLSKEYMVVEWHEPLNKSLVKDTTYKTGPLEEAVEYEFRVYAENIVGIGRCSKISEGCVARDPCDPPGTPEAIIVNKESITIEWTKGVKPVVLLGLWFLTAVKPQCIK